MEKILIWGCGDRAKFYMNVGYFNSVEVFGFIESNPSGTEFMGRTVYSIDEVVSMQEDIDYIVVANEFFESIIETCKTKKISLDKLVLTDNILLDPYREYILPLQKLAPELYNDLLKRGSILVKKNEYDSVDDRIMLGTKKYSRAIYMEDYYRFRTFEFAARQIEAENVEGDVAELGVFRGTFSALINGCFPDRRLYLFDTFEGFNDEEAKEEIDKGRCNESFLIGHTDTSVQRAVNALPNPDKIVVCKGFFPESIPQDIYENKFAFVSIDVDFEKSTYEGLCYFYPRLSEGGMIFIHDYYTYALDGIRDAVKHFEDEQGYKLKKLPLADKSGTLVILK